MNPQEVYKNKRCYAYSGKAKNSTEHMTVTQIVAIATKFIIEKNKL